MAPCLSYKHNALSSIPGTEGEKKKKLSGFKGGINQLNLPPYKTSRIVNFCDGMYLTGHLPNH